ncbi:MAG TPA: hypothetical protein VNB64_04695 [Solirubrobacteraceae bacterium]|nr:hypothetical protein [Solirubrobacteraceae bacterium]
MATAAAAVIVGISGNAAFAHSGHPSARAQKAQTQGRTTLEHTIAGDRNAAFSFLRSAPGEPYTVRQDGVGTARAGREGRRRSLAYVGQLTDFQVSDEESPARVEFVDPTANPPFPSVFSAAWRPQEALVAHGVDMAIRNMNRFVDRSPVAQGDGSRARMSLALMTGDLADNQQHNESEWVRILLEGGPLDPNSGSSDPAHYASCPAGTPGPDEAARYTGVQDSDDYVEGNQFYDPDRPVGQWSAWPSYPGLMDRAQQPFVAEGLRVPSYVTFGNHDGLAQGNAAALRAYEDVGIGCVKPLVPAPNVTSPEGTLNPTFLAGLLATQPQNAMLVPPDPDRRYLDKAQFKALYAGGRQRDAHGFAFVDRAENAASRGAAAYYAWDALPGFRLISIDTLSEAGVAGPSANGNIDDPQWQWLRRELAAAERAGKLIVLFGHHPIGSLNIPLPDENAPPCTTDDAHGHDANPGCDRDPRVSAPMHTGEELRDLLLAHKHAIAYVAGHTHENRITPFARPGGGGFWGIETPSIVDWPPQTRLIEVMDNRDGTLSIFGTILDTEAPVVAAPAGTTAAGLDVPALASIGRTLSFNDPQAGGGTGQGMARDRNVELLIADPRATPPAAGGVTPPPARPRVTPEPRDAGARADGTTGAGTESDLPFTGLQLVAVLLAGTALLGAGLSLRWRLRPPAER